MGDFEPVSEHESKPNPTTTEDIPPVKFQIIIKETLRLLKWWAFGIFVLIFLLTDGCGSCGVFRSIRGKVVDAETGEPIEGVAVGVVYSVLMSTGLGQHTSARDGHETMTDANGEFKIPFNVVLSFPGPGMFRKNPRIYLVKPFYEGLEYAGGSQKLKDEHGEEFSPPYPGKKLIYKMKRLKDEDYSDGIYTISIMWDEMDYMPVLSDIARMEHDRVLNVKDK